MRGNLGARPSLRDGSTDRSTTRHPCFKNAEELCPRGLCPRPFIRAAALYLMLHMWCKGALMTALTPQLPRCDRMDTCGHAVGLARWLRLVGFLVCTVFTLLGITCSLMRFDAGLFRDLRNFRRRFQEPVMAA